MIKKVTTRKTRDYLENVKRQLPYINKKRDFSVTGKANLFHLSPGRMGAAVDLGYFEKTGKNGAYNTYKCKVKYFTLAMANQVIRHEYDKYQHAVASKAAGEQKPSLSKPLISERSPHPEVIEAIDILKDNGYGGILYRDNKALSNIEAIVL